MRGCHPKVAPAEFVAWIGMANEDWVPSYPFNDSGVRNAVVSNLFQAQRGLCVYCGRRLDLSSPGKSFHIEHFRPQSKYEEEAVNFENLFLSCGQEEDPGIRSCTCGTEKDQWFDETMYIEPSYPGCVESFQFKLNGDVVPANGSKAAELMIKVLNLNHREFAKDRERVLFLIDSGDLDASDFIDVGSGYSASYAHVALKHLGQEIP